MSDCPECGKGKGKDFGFGWIEYSCGHVETFCPTEW